jgi:hypothetical protein
MRPRQNPNPHSKRLKQWYLDIELSDTDIPGIFRHQNIGRLNSGETHTDNCMNALLQGVSTKLADQPS